MILSRFRIWLMLLLVVGVLLPRGAVAQRVTILSGGVATLENRGTMDLAADLSVDGPFTPDAGTTVRFSGSGAITSAQKVAFSNLTVDLPTATDRVLLEAALSIADLLDVQQGDVDLNGFVIDLGTTGTLREAPGHTVRGTAGYVEATRTLSPPPGADVSIAGLGLAITSSVHFGTTVLRRGHAIQSDPATGHEGIARYVDILPATNAALDATLLFFYDESELNGLDEATLLLYRSEDEGSSWTEAGGTANPASNVVSLGGIDAFSRWTLAAASTPLPVELTAFDAVVDGAGVHLHWTTASETDNAGFDVQMLETTGSDETWTTLGWVDGHGTTAEAQTYAFRVAGLAPGTHRFRLKQVDFDGTFEHSPVVEAVVSLSEAAMLSAPYPHPVREEAQFRLSVQRPQHVTVAVFDALGRRVRTLHDGPWTASASQVFRFEAGTLSSGIYVIVALGEHVVASQRILVVK